MPWSGTLALSVPKFQQSNEIQKMQFNQSNHSITHACGLICPCLTHPALPTPRHRGTSAHRPAAARAERVSYLKRTKQKQEKQTKICAETYENLDEVVDSQDCNGCLRGKFDLLDLAHCWLNHTGCLVVAHHAVDKVEPIPSSVSLKSTQKEKVQHFLKEISKVKVQS